MIYSFYQKASASIMPTIPWKVEQYKLFGIVIEEGFEFDKNVRKILKDCYSTLKMLRKK